MSERTFKLITPEHAQHLFNARLNIYVSYDTWRGIDLCYVDPDSFRPALKPTFYITTELYNKIMSNRRTPQQQAFIDSKHAQEAWLAGKPIQFKFINQNDDKYSDSTEPAPCFSNPSLVWRPKPEPEKVPFNQQTIPADAWFRARNSETVYKPLHIGALSVGFSNGHVLYQQLADNFEHSTDRINWFPCYTLKS